MKYLKHLFRHWTATDTVITLMFLLLSSVITLAIHVYKQDRNKVVYNPPCLCQQHKPGCPHGIIDECEYQFFVDDTMFTVYNNDRYVGAVPVDGSMGKLILKDNE